MNIFNFFYFFLQFYKFIIFSIILFLILIPENRLGIHLKKDLKVCLLFIFFVLVYLYIKPLLVVIFFISAFESILFIFDVLTKKTTEACVYKKVNSFKNFILNIFAYKYNLVFSWFYSRINAIKHKNNKILILKNFITLIPFFFSGISVVHVRILTELSNIVGKSIDTYNNSLKNKKTVFVIIFLIFTEIVESLNAYFTCYNKLLKNKKIYRFLKEKNNVFLRFITESCIAIKANPKIILEIPQLKNIFKNEFFINEPCQKDIIKTKIFTMLAGKKNDLNVQHFGVQIGGDDDQYIFAESFSSKHKEINTPKSTEIIVGKSFNTEGVLSLVQKDLKIKDTEFSQKFKDNNNIVDEVSEKKFMDQRRINILQKCLDTNSEIKIITKDDEHTAPIKTVITDMPLSAKVELLSVSKASFNVIKKVVNMPNLENEDFEIQTCIVNAILKDVNNDFAKSSTEEIFEIISYFFTEEELVELAMLVNNFSSVDTDNLNNFQD